MLGYFGVASTDLFFMVHTFMAQMGHSQFVNNGMSTIWHQASIQSNDDLITNRPNVGILMEIPSWLRCFYSTIAPELISTVCLLLNDKQLDNIPYISYVLTYVTYILWVNLPDTPPVITSFCTPCRHQLKYCMWYCCSSLVSKGVLNNSSWYWQVWWQHILCWEIVVVKARYLVSKKYTKFIKQDMSNCT